MQIWAEGRLLRHAAAEQENPSCSHFGVPFWAVWTMTASVLDIFFIINMSHLCLSMPPVEPPAKILIQINSEGGFGASAGLQAAV